MPSRFHGFGLVELLIAILVAGMALALTIPALAALGSESAAAAAARELATRFQAQRWQAVARGRSHGLFFEREGTSWVWYEVRDGNGNGLRTAEIRAGTDPRLSGPHRLPHGDRGVRLGFPEGPIPRIPPRRGAIDDLQDPIRFGRADLVSFGPLGTASSGTAYITDGKRTLYAVVLFGPSVRVRVWRYAVKTGRWTL
jgi:type II secretory pathway pseudopilin PulG